MIAPKEPHEFGGVGGLGGVGGAAPYKPAGFLVPEGPVGVLAIQGSFELHLATLRRLGVRSRPVRKPVDLEGLSALILPGGESTVMSLLMQKYSLFEPVRKLGEKGLPMLGTCAGAILLGHGEGIPQRLELAPVELQRNAYGTQVDSFTATLSLKPFSRPFHGIFIRAPRILRLLGPRGPDGGEGRRHRVEAVTLGELHGSPVLVSAGNFLLATFHPELTDDLRIHDYFLRRFVSRKVEEPVLSVGRLAVGR